MPLASRADEPKGFAGLTALVTPLPDASPPKPAPRAELRREEREASPPPAPSSGTSTRPRSAGGTKDSGLPTIIWVSVVLVGLIAVIASANKQKPQYASTTAPPEYRQSPPTTSAQPTAKPTPVPPAPPPTPPEVFEQKPNIPTGSTERTRNEIYYCLLEEERINILRPRTDSMTEFSFNERVRDYNSRCVSYKYYQREMDAAKRQYEANVQAMIAQFIASLTPRKPLARPPPQPQPSVAYTPPAVMPAAPTPARPQPVAPAQSTQIEEVIPPFGQGHRHSREQLYYCYAEGIRLDSAKKAMAGASQRQIDALNERRTDFNTRCTKFKSDAADREAVKSYLPSKRAKLNAEGLAMIKRWKGDSVGQ